MTLNGYSDTIASNLSYDQTWEEYTYVPSGDGDQAYTGNSFTTGSNAGGYTINSITLLFGNSYNTTGTFTLYLCPEIEEAVPDKASGLNIGEISSAINSQKTFTISGGFDATPDTTYWIVGTSDVEGFSWVASSNLTVVGEAGWSFGTTAYINSDDYSIGGTPGTPTTQMFSINAEAIPEPATMGLISLIGIATLATKRLFT
jgi:hypothetical protein